MKVFVAWLLLVLSVPALAQSVEVDDSDSANPPVPQAQPVTGKDKASQYFQQRKKDFNANGGERQTASDPNAPAPHFMAIHFGTFFANQTYNWADTADNIHNFNGGVTYRLGEWVNSMDFSLRVEYTNFAFATQSAKAITISPMLSFPDATSRFPLYFGAAIGPDLFTQQVSGRSPVGLAWQVVGGVRVQNVFDRVGIMVETGIKNHVLLTSVGQFNGVFVNLGLVFAF